MTQVNLPVDLDFALDPSASSDRMNRAMTNLQLRLASLETYKPNFDALFASLQQTGLTRLSDALTPIYDQAAALLTSMSAGNVVDSGTYDPVARLIDVKLLHSSTAGVAPTTLSFGQVALNDADSKLYWLAADGHTIKSLDLTLAAYALINSPALTGTPTAPTATLGTNTTQISTTAFVQAAIAALINAAPVALDTLKELADALGDNPNFATTMTTALGNRVRIDGPGSYTTAQKTQARDNIGVQKENYIINGAMMVSQENGANAATTTGYYPVDQFMAVFSNAGTNTVAQVASLTPSGSPNRIRYTATVADASVGASDYAAIQTRIEGLRVADFGLGGGGAAQQIAIQFGVKAPVGTYCVFITNSAYNRSYVAEYTISAANTDTIISLTIPGDTAGTWLTTSGIGMEIRWGLMAGTMSQQAAGSWGTGNAIGSSNQFNFMGTSGNVFELFDVGLYQGSAAPAFKVPDYASELALCQRYFYGFPGSAAGIAVSAQTAGNPFALPETMRVSPTITISCTASTGPNGIAVPFAVTNKSFVFYNSSSNWTINAVITFGNGTANARL